jgi:hypothetical protein
VIARICDPLGLLVPVIVISKILLQRVWALKIHWNESLPADLHSEWNGCYLQLPLLNDIQFPRNTIIKGATNLELNGFCDIYAVSTRTDISKLDYSLRDQK